MRQGPFAPAEDVARVSRGGERYVPLIDPYDAAMHLGHMASYRHALRYAHGRHVLDVGCGAGYGAHFLASFGASGVVAVDVNAAALAYAQMAYAHSHVHYQLCDGQRLPYADASFDFVFSSQVIEHLLEPKVFLTELKRVLKPDGACLVTTPNKDLFSPDPAETATEFHINEMSPQQFEALARTVFPRVGMSGIPQNCLHMKPDGTVGLKPNEALHLEDYQVQTDDLAHCENILLMGYRRTQSEFPATLPEGLSRASTNLGPCFWDAASAQWIELGLYPSSGPVEDQVRGSQKVVRRGFRSPTGNLFRIDVALRGASTGPVKITLRDRSASGLVLARAVVPPAHRRLSLVLQPIADSAGREFCLELRPRRRPLNALRRGKSTLPVFEYRGGRLSIWTFHQAYL